MHTAMQAAAAAGALTGEATVAVAVKALEKLAHGELVVGEEVVGLVVPLARHCLLCQVCARR